VKRLLPHYRSWQQRHARRSFAAQLRFKEKRRLKRRLAAIRHALPKIVSEIRRHQTKLTAPTRLSFHRNYDEIVSFFSALRDQAAKSQRRLTVDFTKIETISPAASLVLTAEVDRWRRLKGMLLRPIDLDKWNLQVRNTLFQLGFFELLDIQQPDLRAGQHSTNIEFIKFRSGHQTDGRLAKELRQALEDIAGPIEAKKYLYTGLTEAMNNAIQHAYPIDRSYRIPVDHRRWWMCGSFDKSRQLLTILFLDQGVGIPATLPRSKHRNEILEFLRNFHMRKEDDAALIQAAIEIGRSATELEGRGYGLSEMRRFVDNSIDGHLRILSGSGECIYSKGGAVRLRRHGFPVVGTLIEWEVGLGNVEV
jgi:anti-sigma regulatory factor (Ser/Thr protein kinase)